MSRFSRSPVRAPTPPPPTSGDWLQLVTAVFQSAQADKSVRLDEKIDALADRTITLESAVSDLKVGQERLEDRQKELSAGLKELKDGQKQLEDGLKRLEVGLARQTARMLLYIGTAATLLLLAAIGGLGVVLFNFIISAVS